MKTISLIFPHQLFEKSILIDNQNPVYLVEEYLFFSQYKFHQQKILFHRSSMRFYFEYLQEKGLEVHYIESQEERSDIRKLILYFHDLGVEKIDCYDLTDDWLDRRMKSGSKSTGIAIEFHHSPYFLNNRNDLTDFFKPSKKKFYQTKFYTEQRKQRDILINGEGGPEGGKWSFDGENRKKYPKKKTPPPVRYPDADPRFQAAVDYVNQHFSSNPGQLAAHPLYPTDFVGARAWLRQFLEIRFAEFGPYEDAMVASQSILHHSVLTPMLNTGLLTPAEVIEAVLSFSKENDIPLNTTEGFVRQVIGWREFIRGVYQAKGREERTRNFWGFSRKIPPSFYDGTTGILPIDKTIKKLLQTGYNHHIERLMVLGNFMLLCEFDPDEVYRWFMEMYIDAYDWVMVPNVYGMSQFADGGLMSTKPYISSSNYLMKMSDFPKGEWQEVWDALFWRFMHVHRDFFLKNPRLGMLVRTFDKWDADKRNRLLKKAEEYLEELD